MQLSDPEFRNIIPYILEPLNWRDIRSLNCVNREFRKMITGEFENIIRIRIQETLFSIHEMGKCNKKYLEFQGIQSRSVYMIYKKLRDQIEKNLLELLGFESLFLFESEYILQTVLRVIIGELDESKIYSDQNVYPSSIKLLDSIVNQKRIDKTDMLLADKNMLNFCVIICCKTGNESGLIHFLKIISHTYKHSLKYYCQGWEIMADLAPKNKVERFRNYIKKAIQELV